MALLLGTPADADHFSRGYFDPPQTLPTHRGAHRPRAPAREAVTKGAAVDFEISWVESKQQDESESTNWSGWKVSMSPVCPNVTGKEP